MFIHFVGDLTNAFCQVKTEKKRKKSKDSSHDVDGDGGSESEGTPEREPAPPGEDGSVHVENDDKSENEQQIGMV